MLLPSNLLWLNNLGGTPENVPLEAISFFLSIDGKSDIYSTGAIFYEISDRPKMARKKNVLHVNLINQSLQKLEEIIMSTLEEDPANRIATAKQLKQSLETVILG